MAKTIQTRELTEGMKLAEPIVNSFGQTIIPSGTVVTAMHVKVISTWNITTVSVQGENDDEGELVITDNLLQLAAEKLKIRFRWDPRNQNEQDLFSMATTHLATSLARNSGVTS